jgi:hypothetical protein
MADDRDNFVAELRELCEKYDATLSAVAWCFCDDGRPHVEIRVGGQRIAEADAYSSTATFPGASA